MDEMQELLDDFYVVCQPIMLCSNINVIDGYEILLRSKKQPGFPEKMFLWFIEEDQRNSKLMAYYSKELEKLMDTRSDIKLSLNLHPKQLQHPSTWDFLDTISFMKKNVSIELTEHYCEFDPADGEDKLQFYITKLKNKGFSLAIDDVGSGQNNFELVTKNIQNISTIKFSLLNFRDLNENVLFNFLNSWFSLSQQYHLKLIVEGIECEIVSNKLKNLGMIYQQGYYHGKGLVLS
ncbi:EAL domain-containing protein (putative c-di-GMP-specific phosphodiesterase class I) [Trichococcus patagoniensis]|uniref:EAL domain-containing protein (Putative c-di-GMP-specific phosphodiesterase class I) n=1 Tax=Trichococcus patagoniensis TaxID=382641 RepID=A0A2T5IQA8_9LACT|nr:EAL domain-containing protein [Trichococcus patagoniensis]PTQ85980.1 EAL domain-containing protein (putative c-di-GMP-specific phosphodiesterase class I) [Trichococcus patagoniensis]